MTGFDELICGKWAGRAQAYAETFAGQCTHTVEPVLDAVGVRPGTLLLDVGTGAGAIAVAALDRPSSVHRRGLVGWSPSRPNGYGIATPDFRTRFGQVHDRAHPALCTYLRT